MQVERITLYATCCLLISIHLVKDNQFKIKKRIRKEMAFRKNQSQRLTYKLQSTNRNRLIAA